MKNFIIRQTLPGQLLNGACFLPMKSYRCQYLKLQIFICFSIRRDMWQYLLPYRCGITRPSCSLLEGSSQCFHHFSSKKTALIFFLMSLHHLKPCVYCQAARCQRISPVEHAPIHLNKQDWLSFGSFGGPHVPRQLLLKHLALQHFLAVVFTYASCLFPLGSKLARENIPDQIP